MNNLVLYVASQRLDLAIWWLHNFHTISLRLPLVPDALLTYRLILVQQEAQQIQDDSSKLFEEVQTLDYLHLIDHDTSIARSFDLGVMIQV